MRICASIVLVFLVSVCSVISMGGGRPLGCLDEVLSMAVSVNGIRLWIIVIVVVSSLHQSPRCGV